MDMVQTTSNTATQPQSPRKADGINRRQDQPPAALAKSRHAEDGRFYAAIQYEPASSAEEAAQWARRSNLADMVDYAKLPTWAANECNRRVLENLTEFPALRGELEFLGSNLAKSRLNRRYAQSAQIRRLTAENPEWSPAQIDRESRAKSLKVFRRDWGRASHYAGMAFRLPISGISVKYRGEAGPLAAASLRRIVDHELGHLLDWMFEIRHVPIIRRLAIEWPSDATTRDLGKYANKSESEFVAMAWESFRNDALPGALARTVGLEIVEQYGRRFAA